MKNIHFLLLAFILTACASRRDVGVTKFQEDQQRADHFSMIDGQASRLR